MQKEDAIKEALALADRSTIAMLSTNGDGGYPNIKAMIKMENEGLATVWFSTNTSSKRVAQLTRDSKACVYGEKPESPTACSRGEWQNWGFGGGSPYGLFP